MAQITKHFSFDEMTYTEYYELKELNRSEARKNSRIMENIILLCENILEPIREHHKSPVQINSAFRCREVNSAAGGTPGSQHMDGAAADLCIPEVDITKVWRWLVDRSGLRWHQVIYYPKHGFIHVSLPTGRDDMQVLINDK